MLNLKRDESGVVCMPVADLHGVNLRGADLRGANLGCADLRGTNLRRADLRGANLVCANLTGTALRGANLSGANLRGADLRYAVLQGANLPGADLSGVDLRGAEGGLLQVTGLHNYPAILFPQAGGWRLTVGCWEGTTTELRDMIAGDDGWPEAVDDQITERRPLLAALADVCDLHAAAHENDRKATEQWAE